MAIEWKHLVVLILASTLVVLSGCAFLFQETPVLELDSLRLSCAANPEIVDGDLGTEGVLQSIPGVARGGAGVLIRLDKSTYIKHVEIYAASRMFDVRIYVAAEESKGNAETTFEPIRERYAKNSNIIGRGKMKRFRIGREVLYLKLVTGWTVDATSGRKIKNSTTLGYDRVIPMIGPVVREIKFYTIRREADNAVRVMTGGRE